MSVKILALDTATEACSVALWNDGEIIAYYEICPQEQTKRILPLVDKVLTESGVTLNQLNALAFGRGPGSFTGVRVAIGIAQGLALGADLPLIPISTLKTMAQGAFRLNGETRVLTAIDARMSEVYWAAFERIAEGEWQETITESVLSPENAANSLNSLSGDWAYAGTGWQTYPSLAAKNELSLRNSEIVLPDAVDMLPLALVQWNKGEIESVDNVEPIYLRNEVTWKKLPGRE